MCSLLELLDLLRLISSRVFAPCVSLLSSFFFLKFVFYSLVFLDASPVFVVKADFLIFNLPDWT